MERLSFYMGAFVLLLIYNMSSRGEVLTTGEMFGSLVWFLMGVGAYQILKSFIFGKK